MNKNKLLRNIWIVLGLISLFALIQSIIEDKTSTWKIIIPGIVLINSCIGIYNNQLKIIAKK